MYSSGTDRPGELCYYVSILSNHSQMVKVPTWLPDCNSHSVVLLDLFISSNPSICSKVAYTPLRNFDQVSVSVSIEF